MTSTPHDALVKAVFGDPAHASALVRTLVRPSLSAVIAWESMRRESESFIGPDLSSKFTDLLFTVGLAAGGTASIYVLFEHQSSPDQIMPLRMLGYMVRIWERHRRQNAGALPAIIPVVLTNAPDRWRAPVRFWDLVDPVPSGQNGLKPHVPSFSIVVDDLSRLPDRKLKARALAALPKLALWLLRDARDGQLLIRRLDRWLRLFLEVSRATRGTDAMAQLVRYVYEVTEPERFEAFHAKMKKIPELEAHMATMADVLRAQGRKEGLEEGRRALLLEQLVQKFPTISDEYRQRVEQADQAALTTFAARILKAKRIEDVFG